MTADHFGGHYANAGAVEQKMTPLDRAAKRLYDAERHRDDTPWGKARADQREPYRHMAREMFAAAGIGPGFACACGHTCGEAPPRLLDDGDDGRGLR